MHAHHEVQAQQVNEKATLALKLGRVLWVVTPCSKHFTLNYHFGPRSHLSP